MSKIIKAELIGVFHVNNKLGEGVVWDSRTQCLWWTDILDNKIYHLNWQHQKLSQYTTPERVCSFSLTEQPQTLLVAFENGIAFYNPINESKTVSWQKKIYNSKGIRLNDGRTDRQGRFWVGSMIEDESSEDKGKLFSFNAERKLKNHISNLSIPNSLCWSPDSKHMYFADSPTNSIRVYDFDPINGIPSNPKIFAYTKPDIFPDGSDIDSNGNLWNAEWAGSRITQYSPSGTILGHLNLPISQPTCIAFGGPDLDLLFITSAANYLNKEEAEQQPLAGSLFIYKTDYIGLDANIYTDNKSPT